MKKIRERLSVLRQMMVQEGIEAYIVPSSDPHLSEYVAACWRKREWISGFDGSAGTVVVLKEKAGLWTDSRYFLQAERQLEGSGIALFKKGEPDVPEYLAWIAENLKAGEAIGIDGEVFAACEVAEMKEKTASFGLNLRTDLVLIGCDSNDFAIPTERKNLLFIHSEKFAGVSFDEKIKTIRSQLNESKTDFLLLTALDEIAWTFNIRGADIPYNPLTIAYALISNDSTSIFMDREKITPEVNRYFEKNGIKVLPYLSVFEALAQLPPQRRVWIDKRKTNFALCNAIPPSTTVIDRESPVILLKAVKNETEIQGVRNAVIKDGIALVHAFYRLESELQTGQGVTEISFAEKLKKYRMKQPDFFCESFGTIAAYGAHGAIVHYTATPADNAELQPGNLFLVDSGGNYFDGTTDITRTIIIGEAAEQQKQDYTSVLKGHISLATARFPAGTRGVQLDVLARRHLWNQCLNYGHGTGHGIGHFLCVHEGPQNIRIKDNGVELKPGMLLSNEPGLYRKNEYGIRLENMVLVKECRKTEFGRFYEFETLTLFPFDVKLIKFELLSTDEFEWINNYHRDVYEKLSPFLPEKEKNWLKNKTNLTSEYPRF